MADMLSQPAVNPPPPFLYRDIISRAIREDLNHGDITTSCTIPAGQRAEAVIVAKEPCVVAGVFVAKECFLLLDSRVEFVAEAQEGSRVETGGIILECRGDCASLLASERVALNFLQRMCGTATLASRFAQAVSGTGCRVVDTRKTTPGLRILEKYAVRIGGCYNHRFDLSDGILIKDNHIAACSGSVKEAVSRARASAPHGLRIEIEVSSMSELEEALDAGAEAVLLDNMNCAELEEAVRYARDRKPGIILEASGGVTLENVRDIAKTGVDIVSTGALTHSARAVDLSMRITS